MSIEALTWCKNQTCPTPTSKLVLFVLSNYADEAGSCYPSEGHLAKICGVSERSIRRCIAMLADCGYVRVEARAGTSNRYYLGVDTSVRTVRPRVAAYTKEKQKTNNQRRLNELAG